MTGNLLPLLVQNISGEDVMKSNTAGTTRERVEAHEMLVAERTPSRRGVDSGRSWYVLGMLTVAYALAFIDRQLLNLLVDPIKHSLNVSDTQLSLVQGLAFVSAYLLAGPLWGRAVDITNRRNILVLCICVWSISTALCGRADTYAGLFSARFGVGASEACIVPVCWSLISDLFSTQKRARAISIWSTGAFLGAGFSLVGGGLVISAARSLRLTFPVLEPLATWQLAFVIVGIPGVLLAALLLLTVGEPLRRRATGTSTDEQIFTLR